MSLLGRRVYTEASSGLNLKSALEATLVADYGRAARSEKAAAANASADGKPAKDSAYNRWDRVLEEGNQTYTILLVDELDLNRRLVRGLLRTGDYHLLEARRPSEAMDIIQSQKVDLIVVDQMLPEMSGPAFCRTLKNDRSTQLIPVVMTTSIQGVENEVAGFESGADEFLIKPLQPALVRTRIRAMLRNKALIDSLEEAETILFALAQSVEHRDKYTGLHCERLSTYSLGMAKALGLGRKDEQALFRGGYLHDIGKIAIPDAILFKPGRLDETEWEVMRMHTVRGEDICRPMKSLTPVLPIIRGHHEKWDGTGYPDGLRGEEIPLLARIMQVADIYDALTTARPYKPAYSHQDAINVMMEEVHKGWRDPVLVPLFARVADKAIQHRVSESGLSWTAHTAMQESLFHMSVELAK